MFSLEQTPMPILPSFDVPHAPKRARRTSPTLERRVRANLNQLSIPDIQGAAPPLQLMPQGRASVGGLSFDKILLNGAMRNKQLQDAAAAEAPPVPPITATATTPTPIRRTVPVVIAPLRRQGSRASATKNLPVLKGPIGGSPNHSLMALRMASMVKGSADAKAQLKFGGLTKSFQVPGRARSSPYRPPSRALPTRTLNRSFNALCA